MKRTKNIFWIAYFIISFLLFTACDKEISTEAGQDTIGFNIEAITRGSIQNTDNLPGFGVFAYYHATGGFNEAISTPDYMYNISVQKNASDWVYAPLRYWPLNGSLSFFAYAPHSSETGGALSLSSETNAGPPILTYTVSDNVAQQFDLLAATPVYATTDKSNKVHFEFNHALSRINFDAKLSSALPSGWTVQVKEIEIGSFKNKGNYAFDAWVLASDATDKSYAMSVANSLLRNVTVGTTFQPVSADNANLFMIPQSVDPGDIIKITLLFNKNGTPEERVFERPLTDIVTHLEEAKAYNVKITISSPITFDLECQVEDWTTYTITLPPFS